MFAQFQSYIVIGLVVLLLGVSCSFALYHRISKADIALLEQQNITYAIAVKDQARTIEQMVADAEKLAKANKELATSIMKTEMEFANEWAAINALDLSSNEAIKDASELERKVNEEFQKSINNLRTATGGQPVAGVVRDKTTAN